MRVQSSDSVVYAVITRGSYLSIIGPICFCVACLGLAVVVGLRHIMHEQTSHLAFMVHLEQDPEC